jgi:hypothetical protein
VRGAANQPAVADKAPDTFLSVPHCALVTGQLDIGATGSHVLASVQFTDRLDRILESSMSSPEPNARRKATCHNEHRSQYPNKQNGTRDDRKGTQ